MVRNTAREIAIHLSYELSFTDKPVEELLDERLTPESFAALAEQEDWTEEDWEDELYTTLAHEFTHHIEGRAGERGLERKDEQFIEEFRAGRGE